MTISLVVKVQHVALRVQLGRIGAVVSDRIDMRERLHAKFAVETPPKRIEDLVLFLRAVPYCMRH